MQNRTIYHIDCLVTFQEDTIGSIDLNQIANLVKDYMVNPARFSENETFYSFESQETSKIYRASFHRDFVALSGPINLISQLVIELRRMLDEAEEITVFDQAYNHSVKVSAYTTANEIERAFLV